MAIFIASTKSISRGNGQSAVASASYRAGCELEDKRYGKTHDYSKKYGVMSADIILPSALAAANADINRGELWNKAEAAEKRKDARVAREWLVNLPHELSEQDRKELAHSFAQTLADRYGTIADCAIHQPTQKEIDRGADPRNFHAHILFTTRTAALDQDNKIILTDKATIELSDNKRRSLGMERVSHEIKEIRQIWEQLANEKLAEHNHKLIDSRSYAEQGIDIEPQLKMGSVATKLERDKYERELKKAEKAKEEGKHYEIDKTPATQIGTINELINERNELVWGVALENNKRINDKADQIIFNSRKNKEREQSNDRLRARTARANAIGAHTAKNIAWADKRIASVKQRVSDNQSRIERVNKNAGFIEQTVAISKQRLQDSKQAVERSARASEQANHIYERVARYDPNRVRKAKPAPSPFDDNTRRARAAKLDKQQGRADRDARNHRYSDARLFEHTERVKMVLASKLLARNHRDRRVCWESYETAEDYPDKYDRRQADKLDEFAKSLGFEQRPHDYRSNMQEMAKMFTGNFVAQNKAMFELLNRPAAERERYNNVTQDFEDFKKYIDDKRTEFNAGIVEKLGGSGSDVGRMTRDIISSFSYIKALDAYISDDDRAEEAKEVAKEHRADTISKTCYQFKHALSDVHRLSSNEREKHSDALRASLNVFTEQYSQELSKDQNTALQSGISSFNYNQDRVVTQSRGLSR